MEQEGRDIKESSGRKLTRCASAAAQRLSACCQTSCFMCADVKALDISASCRQPFSVYTCDKCENRIGSRRKCVQRIEMMGVWLDIAALII